MEIINRRKLYKLEAKRAKLEEERLANQVGDNANGISEEEVNKKDVCHQHEVHQRLRRRNTEDEYSHGDFQSGTKRRIDADDDNPTDLDCKVDKLKCETDLPESKHRSDYSVLFRIFGIFLTFSSLGFFMIKYYAVP